MRHCEDKGAVFIERQKVIDGVILAVANSVEEIRVNVIVAEAGIEYSRHSAASSVARAGIAKEHGYRGSSTVPRIFNPRFNIRMPSSACSVARAGIAKEHGL